MKKSISLTAMVLFFVLPGFSQFSLSGTVKNSQGSALPGATIQLMNRDQVSVSDESGYYRIPNLPAGAYEISYRFVGYQQVIRDVSLFQDTEVHVRLEVSPLVSDAVVVRGTRASDKDPVVFSELSASDIRQSDRTQDIPYLLDMTPSLVATSDAGTGIGYTGLRIRGTAPSRINVTINGIPYNDSESHDVYWVDIPDFVSSVENIQVQRGLGTSTNGAAAFGANINIQTKKLHAKPYAEWHSSGGSFRTLKNTVSGGTGLLNNRFSVDFRRSDLRTDGYIDRAFAKMSSVYLSGGWYLSKSILKATFFQGKELTYQAWGGVPAELLETNRTFNPYVYENEVDDYLQSHYQLHWSYAPNASLNVSLAAHYTRGIGYYEQYKEAEDYADYLLQPVIIGQDTLVQSDLVRRKWLDNHFYGVIYHLNYSTDQLTLQFGGGLNQYDGDHYGRIVWARFASNSSPDENYYYSKGLKTDGNVFAKANYAITEKLNGFADVQFRMIDYRMDGKDDDQRDISQNHIYPFFNPKMGLLFQSDDFWRIHAIAGIGNREPKRSNFTDASPEQEIKPERMRDVELGVTITPQHWQAGVNVYVMDYKDQLVLTGEINDVGSPIMVNVPDSYRAGIELELGVQLAKKWQWQANATWSRNRIQHFVEYVDDWDTWGQRQFELGETVLAFSPALIMASRMQYTPLAGLSLSWDAKYVGAQYIDNTSNADKMLSPYFLNDLMISYSPKLKWVRDVQFFAKVNNVLDHLYESNAWVYSYFYQGERNQMIGYYPQAGRNFLVGMKLAF